MVGSELNVVTVGCIVSDDGAQKVMHTRKNSSTWETLQDSQRHLWNGLNDLENSERKVIGGSELNVVTIDSIVSDDEAPKVMHTRKNHSIGEKCNKTSHSDHLGLPFACVSVGCLSHVKMNT